jgi:site-specific recombinase XerD
MKIQPNFAKLLQPFFTDRLVGQRNASPHTIVSYRDTFRLLLEFAQKQLRKSPSMLAVEDLDAPFIGRFLNHLEKDHGNTPYGKIIHPCHFTAFILPLF